MGIAYNTSTVRDGLVLHLDAANVKSYPGSGTVWTDVSGQGNNGTLVNSPSMGLSGVGLTASSYVSLSGKYLGTSGSSAVSYSFFVTLPWGSIVGYKTILGIQEAAFARAATFVLNTGSSNLQFDFRNGASVERGIFNADLSSFANTPTQIVYTFQSGVHRLYINSALNSTYNGTATVFPTWLGGSGFAIGDNLDSSRLLGSGTFNALKIYNRVLTATEIRQNFEALRGRYGI
jgi:hypothetical protein